MLVVRKLESNHFSGLPRLKHTNRRESGISLAVVGSPTIDFAGLCEAEMFVMPVTEVTHIHPGSLPLMMKPFRQNHFVLVLVHGLIRNVNRDTTAMELYRIEPMFVKLNNLLPLDSPQFSTNRTERGTGDNTPLGIRGRIEYHGIRS